MFLMELICNANAFQKVISVVMENDIEIAENLVC